MMGVNLTGVFHTVQAAVPEWSTANGADRDDFSNAAQWGAKDRAHSHLLRITQAKARYLYQESSRVDRATTARPARSHHTPKRRWRRCNCSRPPNGRSSMSGSFSPEKAEIALADGIVQIARQRLVSVPIGRPRLCECCVCTYERRKLVMSVEVEQIKPAIGAIIRTDALAVAEQGSGAADVAADRKAWRRRVSARRTHERRAARRSPIILAPVSISRSPRRAAIKSAGSGYNITLDPKINNEPEYVQGTFFWHLDGMPMANIPPPKASVLSCRKKSATGGHTEFASTFAAYDGLTDEEKAAYAKIRVIHSLVAGVREVKSFDELQPHMRIRKAERPLVWTYPSGRKSLLIGYTADEVVGMPKAEGRALLARLLEWAAQPAYSYRHQWQEGDLVVWDNCGALHRVSPLCRRLRPSDASYFRGWRRGRGLTEQSLGEEHEDHDLAQFIDFMGSVLPEFRGDDNAPRSTEPRLRALYRRRHLGNSNQVSGNIFLQHRDNLVPSFANLVGRRADRHH